MELPDYYALLEVEWDAGTTEIRQAFRTLALAHHPDVHDATTPQVSRFQQLVEAHRVLSDPERRARYDAHRAGAVPDHASEPAWPSYEEWVARYASTR